MRTDLRKTSTAVLAILFIVLLFKIFASQALAAQIPATAAGTSNTGEVKLQIIGACNFYIDPYWNLISLCAIPNNKSVNSVFSPVNYRYIMRWNETSQQFDVYSPRAAENPFTEVEEDKSYFIYLEGSQTLFQVSGFLYNDTNVSMVQYWNSPIYPYEFPTTIEKQISSVNTTYRYEMKWNKTSQQFDIYSPKAAVQQFTNISPGEGKLVYIQNATALLMYNKSALR